MTMLGEDNGTARKGTAPRLRQNLDPTKQTKSNEQQKLTIFANFFVFLQFLGEHFFCGFLLGLLKLLLGQLLDPLAKIRS